MALQLLRPEGVVQIRRADALEVVIGRFCYTHSVLVGIDGVLQEWPPASVDALRPEHLEACLGLEPEVVLLGTGARQRFPSPAWLALLPSRGIGCEVMDNAACARTFNLLAAEGRRVVAAFLIEPRSAQP